MEENNSIAFNGTAESIIVARSNIEGDPKSTLLVVGKENDKKQVEVINALQGEDAEALWEMLTVKEDK